MRLHLVKILSSLFFLGVIGIYGKQFWVVFLKDSQQGSLLEFYFPSCPEMMQVILAIVAQLFHSSVPKAGPAGSIFVPQCFKEKQADGFLTVAS